MKKVTKMVLICGVGGSGAVGDLVRLIAELYGSEVSIEVVKDFSINLKRRIVEPPLVFAISYSGNTVETISCLFEALREGFPTVVLSSGGVLKEIALKRRFPWIPVRTGLKPRAALPAMLGGALGALTSLDLLPISEQDVNLTSRRLKELNIESALEYARAIAESQITVVASTRDVSAIAERWKSEIAENSKRVAKLEVYPESAHNDINSWFFFKASVSFIVLEGWKEFSREALRIASSIFEKVGRVLRVEVDRSLGGVLEKTLLAGYSSVLAAQMLGLDPTDTPAIDVYRKELERMWKEREGLVL
ncbi:MAG: SIS domain-containing protein [Acidilobaceae archaeon]